MSRTIRRILEGVIVAVTPMIVGAVAYLFIGVKTSGAQIKYVEQKVTAILVIMEKRLDRIERKLDRAIEDKWKRSQ